jgi:methyl-accepting chemotaxis protein
MYAYNQSNRAFREQAYGHLPAIDLIVEADRDMQQALVSERSLMFLRMNSPEADQELKSHAENLSQVRERWQKYTTLAATDEEKAIWPAFEASLGEWEKVSNEVVGILKEDTPEARRDAIDISQSDGNKRFESARDQLNRLTEIRMAKATGSAATEDRRAKGTQLGTVVAMVAGLLGSLYLSLVLGRTITGPLDEAVRALRGLATGDLNQEVTYASEDEIGQLAEAYRDMTASIREKARILEQVAEGNLSDRVTAASDRDQLAHSITSVMDSVHALVKESSTLTEAALNGRLSVRGDVSKFSGGYRDVIVGVNSTLDAVLHPINEAAEVLRHLAQRDLSARVKGDYQGDHAKIKDSLNVAIENIEQSLDMVRSAVDKMNEASTQIGEQSQFLAQNAGEQASGIEEITASLQEITAMTRQNTASAATARSLSNGACGSAKSGLDSVERLSTAMERIKSSSDSTAKIVKTIDEIAFQTNLLALNAAVEAARAGDAGKGFAVVAEEVRNLAMRSAEAAKSTANLIEESVRNAKVGVEMNAQVLSELQEINGQSEKVGTVIAEIATASEQQSIGISQVTSGVEQINGVTQKIAASSEESASTTHELANQAEELRGLVNQFRFSEQDGRPVTRVSAGSGPKPGKLKVIKGGFQRRTAPAGDWDQGDVEGIRQAF